MKITGREEIHTILDQIYDMHRQTSLLPLDISHCMQLPKDYAVPEWAVKFSNLETHTCVKAHTIYRGITTGDELWEWYIEFLNYFLYKKLGCKSNKPIVFHSCEFLETTYICTLNGTCMAECSANKKE